MANDKWYPRLKKFSNLVATLIFAGFAAVAVWFYVSQNCSCFQNEESKDAQTECCPECCKDAETVAETPAEAAPEASTVAEGAAVETATETVATPAN